MDSFGQNEDFANSLGDMQSNPMFQQISQAMQSDPSLMQAMRDPAIAERLREVQSNPSRMLELMSDPVMAGLMQRMQNLTNGNVGGGNVNRKPPTVITITSGESEFFQLLERSKLENKLLAIDFFTTWCGPCKRISPVFEDLSAEFADSAIFAKIDGDKHREFIVSLGVNAFPTFKFYFNGQSVDEFSGADEPRLRAIITEYANRKGKKVCTCKHFPLRDNEIVRYDSVKFDKVLPKLKEINKSLRDSENPLALHDTCVLDSIVQKIEQKTLYHDSYFTANEYDSIAKISMWPIDAQMPFLHIVRMVLLHPDAAKHFSTDKEFDLVTAVSNIAIHADKPAKAQVALWTLSNAFVRRSLQLHTADRHEKILDATSTILSKFSYNEDGIITSVLGIYINLAIVFQEAPDHYEAGRARLLSCCIEALAFLQNDARIDVQAKFLYRIIIIIGTLVYEVADTTELAHDLDVPTQLSTVAAKFTNNSELQEAVKEVAACMQREISKA